VRGSELSLVGTIGREESCAAPHRSSHVRGREKKVTTNTMHGDITLKKGKWKWSQHKIEEHPVVLGGVKEIARGRASNPKGGANIS